jgi:hypothetical protein
MVRQQKTHSFSPSSSMYEDAIANNEPSQLNEREEIDVGYR